MHTCTNQACDSSLQILRLPEVVRKTGISKTALYQRIREGEFPLPVSLGPRSVGFVAGEVDNFIAELMSRRHAGSNQACAA